MPEILSLSPLPATGIFSSVKKSRQTFVCLLGALYEAYFEFHTATPIPLLASTLGSSTKNAAEYPLSKTCFSPENHAVFMSRKYTSKMQMAAVCALVINKRRPSADVALRARAPTKRTTFSDKSTA